MRFLNAKYHTPPEAKANHKLPLKPRQSNQAPKSTKDVDSPRNREHKVLSIELRHPQDKHRPVNNKANQNAYDLGTKATGARIIINGHKQNPLAIHNKKNVDHHSNLSQNRGRNQSTEGHIYTGDEHHDRTNMGRNQCIVTQSGEQIKPHNKQV
jgi:hypothetical protein